MADAAAECGWDISRVRTGRICAAHESLIGGLEVREARRKSYPGAVAAAWSDCCADRSAADRPAAPVGSPPMSCGTGFPPNGT